MEVGVALQLCYWKEVTGEVVADEKLAKEVEEVVAAEVAP